MIAVNLRKQIK